MKISHIMSVSKVLTDLCVIRQKIRIKNTFSDIVYNVLAVLEEHKKVCLKVNGKESLKLKSGSIKFKNCFKQLSVPFKI